MPNPSRSSSSKQNAPRVRISFEREEGGRSIEVELPFVVGVLGDFAGSPRRRKKPLAERKFITVDSDNFDDVLARIAPGLDLRVENRLEDDGTDIVARLDFRSMHDFEPKGVASQVPPLARLLAVRNKLASLVSALERSGQLRAKVERLLGEASPPEKARVAKERREEADGRQFEDPTRP